MVRLAELAQGTRRFAISSQESPWARPHLFVREAVLLSALTAVSARGSNFERSGFQSCNQVGESFRMPPRRCPGLLVLCVWRRCGWGLAAAIRAAVGVQTETRRSEPMTSVPAAHKTSL